MSRTDILFLSHEQLATLVSGIRWEVMYGFRLHGPCSVARVAESTGRSRESLYHHVRELVGVGLLREAGSVPRGARVEKLYDVVSERLRVKPKPWDPAYASDAAQLFKGDFKIAERHCMEAISVLAGSKDLNLSQHIRRGVYRASPAKLEELQRRLGELDDWLRSDGGEGEEISVLLAVNPIV